MKLYLTQLLPSQLSFWLKTLALFTRTFSSLTLNLFTQNYFFSWQVSNYANAYWFLYSNKNIVLNSRHI